MRISLRTAVATAALATTAALAAAASQPPVAAIRLNQVGVERDGPKLAVLPSSGTAPLRWTLRDANGAAVAQGSTNPFGADAASGETLHRIDFGTVRASGEGFRLEVGNKRSHPFAINARPFARLATEAMSFFYQQRSGIPIEAAYVQRPDLARAAGHPREVVTCFSGTDQQGVKWPGCDHRLDTTGGWYDAGDHGKYVVNGGISAWTLLDLHERLADWGDAGAFADGRLALPERNNGRDDLLDEARVEVNFLMAMQIPDGTRMRVATRAGGREPSGGFEERDVGGLAHTKVADEQWTALPTAPAEDRQPRFLYPPSTAATLNLAAVAAKAARVYRTSDPAFAARALASARRAWDAAERHPALMTNSAFTGSGGYGDDKLADERFWAAAELFVTTGDARYAAVVEPSPFLAGPKADLSWGSTGLAGALTLATVPSRLPPATRAALRDRLVAVADGLLAERARSGYAVPYAGTRYGWGSNSDLLNRAMLLGVAWQISRNEAYRTGAVDVVDYLLGRNPLDQSYVTGFGERPMRAPHHRFWMGVGDRRYPLPPPGVVSGGPNSTSRSRDDAGPPAGCPPQACWRDDWRAFTLNEVAINWNAPLVWVAGFLDATRDAQGRRRPGDGPLIAGRAL